MAIKTKAPTAYPIHPFSEAFPLDEGTLDDLKADLKENGQIEPIMLFEKYVIDGRRRQKCLLALGIRPKYQQFVGDYEDARTYVLSRNLHRRHLSEADRAIVAAKLATMARGRPKKHEENGKNGASAPFSIAQAAEALNVSDDAVKRARAIAGRPELQEQVHEGEKSLSQAAAEAQATKDILCPRCKRVGATTNCKVCADLRAKAAKRAMKKAKRKSGSEAYSWKEFHDSLGRQVRFLEAFGRAHRAGRTPKAGILRAYLSDYLREFKLWAKELTGEEMPRH